MTKMLTKKKKYYYNSTSLPPHHLRSSSYNGPRLPSSSKPTKISSLTVKFGIRISSSSSSSSLSMVISSNISVSFSPPPPSSSFNGVIGEAAGEEEEATRAVAVSEGSGPAVAGCRVGTEEEDLFRELPAREFR